MTERKSKQEMKSNSEHEDNLRLARVIFGESSTEYREMLAHDQEQAERPGKSDEAQDA